MSRIRFHSHFLPILALTVALVLALSGCVAATPMLSPTPTPAPTATPTPTPEPDTVLFLVSEAGEAVHGDSYVLPLSRPEDIAAARAILAERKKDPAVSKIVIAKIAKGPGEGLLENRDVLRGKNWSWHVSEFVGFADMSVEIYDGWPSYVEENLDDWIANTQGTVGFWSYTVTQELPAP